MKLKKEIKHKDTKKQYGTSALQFLKSRGAN